MNNTNNINEIVKNIDGWITKKEVEALYFLAKDCKGEGVIVEIGSWKGKSTICLAKGSIDGSQKTVYAIDHHTGSSEHRKRRGEVWTYGIFAKNIEDADVKRIIKPIIKSSQEASLSFDKPIDLIFIDGDHSYEGVKKDYELWFPKVSYGGIMAFHDTTTWKGPSELVREKVFNSKYFKKPVIADSITYAIKVKKISLFEILRKRLIYIYKRLVEKKQKYQPPRSS